MNVTIEDLVNAFRAEATEISQKQEKAKLDLLSQIRDEMGKASENLEPIQLQLFELGKHAPEVMQWQVSGIMLKSDSYYGWAELEVSFKAITASQAYSIAKKFTSSKYGQHVGSVKGGLLCPIPHDHREAIICLSKLIGQVLATGACSVR